MGRQGPRLVPFLQNGLISRKYRNLISEDPSGLIFSIVLPHKTKKLDAEDEVIFKDWYSLNGKKYVFASKHYTDAKQAITASLRKSDYVNKVHISDDKLTYRILNKAEVKEKKRLKKEVKKEKIKKEASDSDDVLSSIESGYGSSDDALPSVELRYGDGSDLLQNDYAASLNNNFVSGGEESSKAFLAMETNNLFQTNDAQQSTYDKFDGFPKPEYMDSCISAEKFLAVSDTPILFESYFRTKVQPFADTLKSIDYFPECTEHLSHSLDLMECSSDNLELNSSGFFEDIPDGYDLLQLDGLSDEDLNNLLLKDVPMFNFNPLACDENINNHVSEIQNIPELYTEPEDLLTKELWNKLMEDISTINSHTSVAVEENIQDQLSSPLDAALPDHKTEERENLYFCKKCVHLGKIPILLCEPQPETSIAKTSGEIKIAFEETVWKDINGFKSLKEFKFVNDHLMVFLEPNDD